MIWNLPSLLIVQVTAKRKMQYKSHLPLLRILTAILACSIKSVSLEILRREFAEVKFGTYKCTSNCSDLSSEGNSLIQCRVEECGTLEPAEDASQASRIAKEDIFFERYTDEQEERNRLSLHVKWSSTDNVSLEHTKGYLVNITDGESSYIRCYNLSTRAKFSSINHGKFFSDCFGKAPGTRVKLGSTITVRITTLPTWKYNKEIGTVSWVIEVPDCTNEKLHTFKECETDGGRPTSRSCAATCNTTSAVNGTLHPVSCTLSSETDIIGLELCKKQNRTADGTPTPPRHLKRTQEWYKYIDGETGDVKIALNFSWTPRDDTSLQDLHGYELSVLSKDKPTAGAHLTKCFAIHTYLKPNEHHKAEFFYDCYGRTWHSDVVPGHSYHVHIDSFPTSAYSNSMETFEIKVPSCADKSVQDVTFCKNENNRVLNLSVDEIFCYNRSLKLSYEVSPDYGTMADIVFCERGKHLRVCDKQVNKLKNLGPKYPWEDPCLCRKLYDKITVPLSNTIYNLTLPSWSNLSLPYVVIVHGTNYPAVQARKNVNFSVCVQPKRKVSPYSLLALAIPIVAILLCAAGIIFVILCFCRKDSSLKKCMQWRSRTRTRESVRSLMPRPVTEERPLSFHIEDSALITKHVRVYVVFAEDCELHLEVIHCFCSFLMRDLGIEVKSSIWDKEEVAVNSIQYMESNLRNSDKVVVICSRGMRDCLSKTDYDGNMYAPVVQKICQQAFIGQNPGKFIVGYFPYSTREDVPELLRDQCQMYFTLYALMKQFEQFYFRLIEEEQYMEGHIRRIDKIAFDRYHEKELTTCGMDLKLSIEHMEAFVRSHPTWYNDTHGADVPQAVPPPVPRPTPSLHVSASITDPMDGRPSIVHIHAAPPQEMANGNPRAQRLVGDAPPQQAPQPPLFPQRDDVAVRNRYQRLPFTATFSSTDSSFMVPETEFEDLSTHTRTGPKSAHEAEWSSLDRCLPQQSVGLFYHPGFFNESDFEAMDCDDGIDSAVLTNLPSDVTQITRVGLSASMERVTDLSQQHLITPVIQPEEKENMNESHPLITLASIEDDVATIEDQFKTINFC